MTDRPDRSAWADMHAQLTASMPGFDGLILVVQGLLVGESLATGTIPHTPDVATTVAIAKGLLAEVARMCEAWGVEQ